ncbi:MAG: nuclear transport factor 2 family protein [Planctomycetia bacterium]|nr:nuclear transport factor 2 family protein [Planctomycetia bacterium]
MSWLSENAWPLIIFLGLVAAACVAVWSSQKRGRWLIGAVAAAAAAVVVFFVERQIVTESERVAEQVHQLVDAFTKKDRDRTLAFFSAQARDLRANCETALTWVDFPNGLDIKDVNIKMSNENTRAISHFRANGTVSYRGMGASHAASRWEVTWQKEAGQWKIVEVQRLHPYKDEKWDIFEPRQN